MQAAGFRWLLGVVVFLSAGSKYAWSADANGSDRAIRMAQVVAQQVADNMQSALPFAIEVVAAGRQDLSPFSSVVSSRQTCLLVVNTNPKAWGVWAQFKSDAGNLSDLGGYRFAALHEIGHCQNKLAPSEGTSSVQPGSDSELYADVFAIRRLTELYGQDYARELAFQVLRARKAQDHISKTHAIGMRLQAELGGLINPAPAS